MDKQPKKSKSGKPARPAQATTTPASTLADPNRRSLLISIVSLVIGAVGGVPGYFTIRTYLDRSSARIMFNEKESVLCRIANSPNVDLNGRLAILLYGVTIVGAGENKFVAFNVIVSIRASGNWYDGKRFVPYQRHFTDPTGVSGRAVQLHVGTPKPTSEQQASKNSAMGLGDTINLLEWRDFTPGVSVGFGEPTNFMVASYFPSLPKNDFILDRMRITVVDYLGNSYEQEYGVEGLRRPNVTLYLDQESDDPPAK